MKKLIWSNRDVVNYLMDLDHDELLNTLVNDFGYDEEFLQGTDLEEVVYEDVDVFEDDDEERFYQEIVPMIAKQTYNGLVVVKNLIDEPLVYPVDDLYTELSPETKDELYFYDEDGNLVAENHENKKIEFFAIPEDIDLLWVKNHMSDAIDDYFMIYGDEISYEDAAQYILDNIDEYIDECDFEGLDPIKVTEISATESLTEDFTNDDEIYAVKDLLKYGIENGGICTFKGKVDDNSFKVVFVDEIGDEVEKVLPNKYLKYFSRVDESLTEASKTFYADNLDKLEAELEELEYDYNAFGADGFYAIPLKNFKREFPEFFKGVIATFLKSIVDIDVDTEDPEELNDAWQSGDLITEQDWEALFEGAHVLLDNNGKGYGWIAIWKKYYNNFE